MGNGVIGERHGKLGIWGGLAAAAAALTLAGAGDAQPAGIAHAQDREAACASGEGGARVDGRGRDDAHAMTPERAAEYERQLQAKSVEQQAPEARRTVPVVVHVISAADGTGALDDATVDRQIDVLNKAYGGGFAGADTGFRFELKGVTRSENDSWFSDFAAQEKAAKSKLREGGAGTLNLYTVNLGEGVLGHSTYPQEYADDPASDGVTVDHRSVPGGEREKFDLGMTAVHETGHWLGLFHTFQNGCSSPGDYVADTPYEREQSTGCPKGRDTCPRREGKDPVTNFMNYSDDACMDRFTKGQATRMAEHWAAFRE